MADELSGIGDELLELSAIDVDNDSDDDDVDADVVDVVALVLSFVNLICFSENVINNNNSVMLKKN